MALAGKGRLANVGSMQVMDDCISSMGLLSRLFSTDCIARCHCSSSNKQTLSAFLSQMQTFLFTPINT